MKRSSLALKIGLSITGLIVIVLILLYVSVDRLFQRAYYHQSAIELQEQGQAYAKLIQAAAPGSIHKICMVSDEELLVINASGIPIAKSDSAPLRQKNNFLRRNIDFALKGRTVVTDGYSPMFGNSGVLSLTPVKKGNVVADVVALFQPFNQIAQAYKRVETMLLMAGLGAILLAVGLTILLSKSMTQPLRQMAYATRLIGRGNYEVQLPVRSEDEIGRLASAINDMTSSLYHLDNTRKEFLADVSHELRTPISYIRGYSQALRENLAKTLDERNKFTEIIYDESRRLEKLVTDLFMLSQMDTATFPIARQEVQLPTLVSSVVERLRHTAKVKDITIHYHALGDVGTSTWLDPLRIEQVIVNLLDNAIRYTPSGGDIQVKVRQTEVNATIQVSDSGIGIPGDELSLIWNRLYRSEKSRSREQGGAGLGLSIVKRIVELHGGTIDVSSTVGEGTTFTFTIPARRGDGQHAEN